MGIRAHEAAFLFDAVHRGLIFGRSLTLGRQLFCGSHAAIFEARRVFGNWFPKDRLTQFLTETISKTPPVEGFLQALGATSVDSLDYSAYEGASHIYDLNEPLPEELFGSYDTVLDFGTLEHVFNVPQALANSLKLVKQGGYYLAALPANNTTGHGFYQFSPEFFYSVLQPLNGYRIERLLGAETIKAPAFYELPDPRITQKRVELRTSEETYLFILARRTGLVPDQLSAYQSDYEKIWRDRQLTESQRDRWSRFSSWANATFPNVVRRAGLFFRQKGKRLKCFVKYNPQNASGLPL